MPFRKKWSVRPDSPARPGPAAVAAVAAAFPAALAFPATTDTMVAAAAFGTLAGLFDFLSRPKKKEELSPPGSGPPDDATGPAAGLDGPGEAPTHERPRPEKLPGKKGDAPPRPRPRRSDYTGQRVGVHVPGRKAEAASGPPARPSAEGKPADPEPAVCPGCREPSVGPGRFCDECEATRFVTEVGSLVSSLKTREVNMMPAERYLFQARSALAVGAWKDVMRLAAQAEAAAREQEADFEESRRILTGCEETIATAIEAGRDTLAAEKTFRRATMLFKEGRYTGCMEEAVLIPAMIMDRPRPRLLPAGTGPGGPAGETPAGTRAATDDTPPAPEDEIRALMAPVRCQSCGERIEPGPGACPACGGPTCRAGPPGWQDARSCACCGEPLEPAWRVCPACNTPAAGGPEDTGGRCPACGREVLPSWSICPFCEATLRQGSPAVKVRKGFSRPEKPGPSIPPALREKGVLEQIGEVDRLLDEAARRAQDVRKARNLLELAVDFTRNGNYDKSERYVRKARNVAETLLTVDGGAGEP